MASRTTTPAAPAVSAELAVPAPPSVPRHNGYILDGNRRWAKKHGLPVYEGHLAGYNSLKEVALATLAAGVEYMSIYSFSIENWKRDKEEVSNIMSLMMRLFTTDMKMFDDNNIRLKVIGSSIHLTKKMMSAMADAEERTKNYTSGTLVICFNYSGQQEIADAVKRIIDKGTPSEAVTTELLEQHLYAPEIPPVDLVVRSSGEQRISNFMLWRAAYSEFLFVDKFWPEMTKKDVTAILDAYTSRQRRFGK